MKYILLLLLTTTYLSALVSIVPVEIGVKPGYSGNLEASLETKRGNTHKDNYKLGTRLNYDNNKNFVTWAEISGEYGESNEIKDTSKMYLHVRHIHALSQEDIRAEVFAQAEEDEFKLIKRRLLAGGGVRTKIFDGNLGNGKGYIGTGAYFEQVRYTSTDPEEDSARANLYFAYTSDFGADSKVSYSAYYQPNIEAFSDYITAQKLELKLHLYKKLFLKFQIAYDSDSKAPVGVEKYDFTQTTAFVLNF